MVPTPDRIGKILKLNFFKVNGGSFDPPLHGRVKILKINKTFKIY